MESDDKTSTFEPEYPADLHSDVVGECREYRTKGRPWTKLRVLRKGVDASEGASCTNSQGNFHQECSKKVEAVQYDTTFGAPQWYCEEHALKQADWDVIFYDSKPKPTPDLTSEQKSFIEKLLSKGKKKEKKEEEKVEYDP